MSMPKRVDDGKNDSKHDLWIAPSHTLEFRPPRIGWEIRPGEPEPSNRFLELADIAFGVKNMPTRKNRRAA